MMYIQMHRILSRINLIFNIEWCLHLDRKCETRFTSEIVFYGPARTSRDFVFHHSFVLGSKRELLRTYRIVRSILQVIFYVRLTCCSMIFYFFLVRFVIELFTFDKKKHALIQQLVRELRAWSLRLVGVSIS